MDRSWSEALTVDLVDEQTQLTRLQDKTVARLHFIEGALFVLDEIRRKANARDGQTSGNREEVKGNSEAETPEEKL